MGCDFSHCNFRMSYGGFASLREKLAREAGLQLHDMEGYGGTRPWDGIEDPLVALLSANDEYGGGEIPARDCLSLHRRIRELASRWSHPNHLDHTWQEQALALAHAIGEAALLGETFFWF